MYAGETMVETEVLWRPSRERVERSNLTAYTEWLRDTRGLRFADYEQLRRWSVEHLEDFWQSLVERFNVRFTTSPTAVLDDRTMPGARWFPGAELNYAEHIFSGRDPLAPAIRHTSELRDLSTWTWGDLRAQTALIAAGLRQLGVGPGDRVAAYMPNIPETVAALLATASLGAVWSAAAPEFGAHGVIDRFAQIKPKVLLAVDGYRYGGRDFDRSPIVEEIAAAIPSHPTVVRFGYLDGSGWPQGFGHNPGTSAGALTYAPVPFEHPLWVLYSSGTTGLPKPIVHSQGGILLEQLKMGFLQLDAHADDRVFWFTTTGWMMWNFLVGVLLTDASIILYDGNPGYPDLGCLWELAAQSGMSCFGTSAAFISACMKAAIEPRAARDLSRLRAVGSTGSPLSPESFRWVYEHIGADTWLFSTSGGTDLCTAFVGGVPTLPVKLGELQGRALGAAVEAFDEQGEPLIGKVGELVITEPMPSMPVYLWGDEGDERYRESYFSTYPGIWRHGDWIEITPDGGAIIYGRSDSTINRGGVRIGTSEIYRVVLAVPQITEALVVDLPREGTDGSTELFIVLREGHELDDRLRAEIRGRLRRDCSPRHVPDAITQIREVPRTLSGKIVEVPVKRILMGADPERAVSREALANPAALDPFIAMAAGRRAVA